MGRTLSESKSRLRLIALCLSLLLLSGCGLSLPGTGPAPDLYDLSPKSTFDTGLPTADWQLVIEEPAGSRAIDTDRIAIRTAPYELKYFGGARWSDRAPRMVQTLLVESFENSGKIIGVGRQAIGLRGDYDLKPELREFHAELFENTDAPLIRVRINTKVIKQPSAVIIASENFERTASAEGDKIEHIVAAFDEALGSVMKRVIGWTLTVVDEHIRERQLARELRRMTPLSGLTQSNPRRSNGVSEEDDSPRNVDPTSDAVPAIGPDPADQN